MRRLLIAAALLALPGCGKQVDLKPATGKAMPMKAKTAATPPTIGQLLKPRPEQVPARTDEPLTRSQPRADDRFDLPPPG